MISLDVARWSTNQQKSPMSYFIMTIIGLKIIKFQFERKTTLICGENSKFEIYRVNKRNFDKPFLE